jgi:hypothetical protein
LSESMNDKPDAKEKMSLADIFVKNAFTFRLGGSEYVYDVMVGRKTKEQRGALQRDAS